MPLHYATAYEHQEIVEMLLNHGADVNVKDGEGHTPLHCAIYSNNIEMLKIFVKSGADTKIKNPSGNTPKDIAINRGYSEIVEYLSSIEELAQERSQLIVKEEVGGIFYKQRDEDNRPEESDIGFPGQEAPEGNGDN